MNEKLLRLSDVVVKVLATYFLAVHLLGIMWFIDDVGISSIYDISIIMSMLIFIFHSLVIRIGSIVAISASIIVLTISVLIICKEIFFNSSGTILERLSLYVIILVAVHMYAIFRFSCQLLDGRIDVSGR